MLHQPPSLIELLRRREYAFVVQIVEFADWQLASCKTFVLVLCILTIVYSVSANGAPHSALRILCSRAKTQYLSQPTSPFDITRYGIIDL